MNTQRLPFLFAMAVALSSSGTLYAAQSVPVAVDGLGPVAGKKKLGVFPGMAGDEAHLKQILKGDDWIPAKVLTGSGIKRPRRCPYVIRLDPLEEASGDLERFNATFILKGKERALSKNPIAYVVPSPTFKYLIIEPLVLVDVDSWKSYDLTRIVGLHPYVKAHRWSKDGSRLVVSQFDCAFDCPPDQKVTYWQIEFGKATKRK